MSASRSSTARPCWTRPGPDGRRAAPAPLSSLPEGGRGAVLSGVARRLRGRCVPEYRARTEAAYGQRALRGLHPFTSHRTHSASPPAPALACRRPDAPGRTPRGAWFTVSTRHMGEKALAETSTPQEAVGAAVHRLPQRRGPVTQDRGRRAGDAHRAPARGTRAVRPRARRERNAGFPRP
ncbi:DUF6193 family natural product biosynthesis protein [Streptomyces atroolivaceus]|uniref:DUF6193 family natural product biosynthesis protein n=1 Tax=Streptomyces atroolivaceus TaxID=66869 RepID=UPI00364F84FD